MVLGHLAQDGHLDFWRCVPTSPTLWFFNTFRAQAHHMTTGKHLPNATGGGQNFMLSLSFPTVSWSMVNSCLLIYQSSLDLRYSFDPDHTSRPLTVFQMSCYPQSLQICIIKTFLLSIANLGSDAYLPKVNCLFCLSMQREASPDLLNFRWCLHSLLFKKKKKKKLCFFIPHIFYIK